MNEPTLPTTRADAEALDLTDPLAELRDRFKLPDNTTYLVGHSLGPASHGALARVRQAAEQEWADGLVGSWNSAGWIDLASKVGSRLARLIGAPAADVVVCDSVSVNLFKLAVAALPLAKTRSISVEADDFPTDQYVAESAARTAGALYRQLPPGGALAGLHEGGVLIKSAVSYRTSEIADIAAYERVAQSVGAVIIWDLSHAAGVVPLDLETCGARLAAGCTYKYLNGGPGAPSFVYAHRTVAPQLWNPIAGWLGHASPFAFTSDYQPADGVGRMTTGTPSILSLAALDGALDVFEGVDLNYVVEKARRLGDMVLSKATALDLRHSSPLRERRGGHICLHHDQGYGVVQALASRGVKSDFRTPDTVRWGLSPLFLRYAELWDACEQLGQVMMDKEWSDPAYQVQQKVT